MKIFFISFIFIFVLLAPQIGAIEIESVRVGWGEDGYYRLGYFTPAQIRLKSDTDFEGFVTIQISNLSYSKYFRISKDTIADVKLDVLILTDQPNIEITYGKDKNTVIGRFSNVTQAKHISKDEFLIAVEKSYLTIFRDEFTQKYPDAAKKTKFISFQTDELPQTAQSYESLDLVVLSSANLSAPIQNALYQWCTDMDGIVLYKLGDIETLSQLFGDRREPFIPRHEGHSAYREKGISRSDNPCLNPDIYNFYSQKSMPEAVKKTLSNYILIYAIITIIIAFLLSWLSRTKKIILTIVIATVSAIVLLYVFYLPSQGVIFEKIIFDNSTGKYNLISTVGRRGAPSRCIGKSILPEKGNVFISVTDYSNEKHLPDLSSVQAGWITMPLQEVTDIKPLYRNTESIQMTKIYFRFLADKTQIKWLDAKRHGAVAPINNTSNKTFIFQTRHQ